MKKSNLVKEAVCGVNVELTTADMWALAPISERINIFLKTEKWRGGRYNNNDPEKWAKDCGFESAENAETLRRSVSDSQFKEDVYTLMRFVNKLTVNIPKSNIFDED